MSAVPVVSNIPTQEPSKATSTENTFIKSMANLSKPVETSETENEDWDEGLRLPFSIFTHVAGFTHFISQRNPSFPDKIFAGSLFASGHGYPLFHPDATEVNDEMRGTCIGDVGFLSVDNMFLFLFNIFLPRTTLTTRNTPPNHSFR
ncbi:hypothetical protein M413DRAFT_359356 [Hebeloma cylindrosporum]|uniref:Uncharacterized protein n=1 Tax=Hebeloma cylindrosporum TaxID=76867 RepID=A0A0C3CLP2_HEBCY|nr:hypothetical protein M413DRAFT_359356 [Hebeloma cylindrosporum h7]